MRLQEDTPLLVVAGPTASGKSSAALVLASMVGGHVINADSMQVYRDLRVVTARPGPEDLRRVPHHLYGHVDAGSRYSAGRFVSEAKPLIEELRAAGTVPILCGGTGMYLQALVEGLSPIPDVDPWVTERLEERWEEDPAAFRAQLLENDPAMEWLAPADRQRHVRAAAVLEGTGRALSAWQKEPRQPAYVGPMSAACLLPERSELYDRCDARFDAMLAEGAVDEVRSLLARELPEDMPAMKSLGVPELTSFVRGEISLDEAAEKAKQETRRFAKRQMTWFRNQTDWPAFTHPEELTQKLAATLL